MKVTPHILVSLCFIIFSIYINSLLCAAAEEAVVDLDGNELKVGSKYYMVSAIRAPVGGGGVTLSLIGNDRCPVIVGQHSSDSLDGLPLSLHPDNSEESVVRVSTRVNIKFEVPVRCVNSTVWRVGRLDAWTRARFIEIEGEQGKPGCDWFRIEKLLAVENVYKLVFDPLGRCGIPATGDNVAVIQNIEEERILALSSVYTFPFVFKKVEEPNQAY